MRDLAIGFYQSQVREESDVRERCQSARAANLPGHLNKDSATPSRRTSLAMEFAQAGNRPLCRRQRKNRFSTAPTVRESDSRGKCIRLVGLDFVTRRRGAP